MRILLLKVLITILAGRSRWLKEEAAIWLLTNLRTRKDSPVNPMMLSWISGEILAQRKRDKT